MDPPIGQLIRTAESGDTAAADALFAELYRELHSIAERELNRRGADLTLGTTTLLHEAYLNIAGREGMAVALEMGDVAGQPEVPVLAEGVGQAAPHEVSRRRKLAEDRGDGAPVII